jgi:hypothetical protein
MAVTVMSENPGPSCVFLSCGCSGSSDSCDMSHSVRHQGSGKRTK